MISLVTCSAALAALVLLAGPANTEELIGGAPPLLKRMTKVITCPDGSTDTITTFRIPRGVDKMDTKDRWIHLERGGSEWNTVTKFIPDKYRLTYIGRNENVFLWFLYRSERRDMRDRDTASNERLLWFVADDHPATARAFHNGFSVSASYAKGILGAGLHFYTQFEDAIKHTQLSDDGYYDIILARVALGVMCTYDGETKLAHAPPGCDSVKSQDGRVIAVFRPGQAYPNYKTWAYV